MPSWLKNKEKIITEDKSNYKQWFECTQEGEQIRLKCVRDSKVREISIYYQQLKQKRKKERKKNQKKTTKIKNNKTKTVHKLESKCKWWLVKKIEKLSYLPQVSENFATDKDSSFNRFIQILLLQTKYQFTGNMVEI